MRSKKLPLILAWLVVSVLAGFLGYESIPDATPTAHRVDVVVLDPSLQETAELWRIEIARRFPDAVAIFVHGRDELGVWQCKAPMLDSDHCTADEVAAYFKAKYPNRVIVLLSCNPGHLHLHVHGVWHFMNNVWIYPDRAIPEDQVGRSQADSSTDGNIFEALQD